MSALTANLSGPVQSNNYQIKWKNDIIFCLIERHKLKGYNDNKRNDKCNVREKQGNFETLKN